MHAQRCIEKYFEAVLQEAGVSFPKTHDLVVLADLATAVHSRVAELRQSCAQISAYAIQKATRDVARRAVATVAAMRQSLREVLGLPRRR